MVDSASLADTTADGMGDDDHVPINLLVAENDDGSQTANDDQNSPLVQIQR